MRLSRSRSQPATLSAALLIVAWAVTLMVSDLPDILMREVTGDALPWLLWSKALLLVLLLAASLSWQAIRPLRDYGVILLVILLASYISLRLASTGWWQGRFTAAEASFALSMLGEQLRRLSVSLVVIAAFLLLRYRRSQFFLVKGQLDAIGAPIRWLGITRPYSYRRFGPLAALCISLGLGAFLVIGGGWPHLTPGNVTVVAVVAVVLLAALNAFSENMTYRAAPLATLEPAVGPGQAMVLGAVLFGIGHFYGVPYGVVGVIMAGGLGWILNKTMLETRGFAWPWFIHFCQDALVFSFMALGAVAAGG